MITNYMSVLEFKAAIKRLPNVEFFLQRATIPSISQNPVENSTPFNRVFHSADKLQYANFDFTFIVDEKMNNYLEIFNWMKGLTFPENFNQFKNLKGSEDSLYSDVTIQILNSHKNADIEVTFVNCFPISLSDVVLDTTQSDIVYPEVTVTFQYDYFNITRLKD
jgi:hypothetical protein